MPPLVDPDGPLRVAVLFSGGASGLRYLGHHDDGYGEHYEVVAAFTDKPGAPGVRVARDLGVPVESNDIDAFYADRDAPIRDLDVRADFDERTRDLLTPYEPDVVMLSGYMKILTDAVVERWPVVNVHPADLRVEDDEGERRYTGFDPVHDAIRDGADETRSSVHLVTSAVDDGPLLVVSRAFPVQRELVDALEAFDADGALRSYVEAHQEWMKWRGDGPALAEALAQLADGAVALEGDRATVAGEPAPLVLED
jgi:folate-dependent phosphoribosylglycinamide formyltransferase PurN